VTRHKINPRYVVFNKQRLGAHSAVVEIEEDFEGEDTITKALVVCEQPPPVDIDRLVDITLFITGGKIVLEDFLVESVGGGIVEAEKTDVSDMGSVLDQDPYDGDDDPQVEGWVVEEEDDEDDDESEGSVNGTGVDIEVEVEPQEPQEAQ
jgi:hypothetical protein